MTTSKRLSLASAAAGVRRQAGGAARLPVGAARIVLCLMVAVATVLFSGLTSAQKQRVVNYYNWSDYQDPTVLDAFTKETGIAVRFAQLQKRPCLTLAGSSIHSF